MTVKILTEDQTEMLTAALELGGSAWTFRKSYSGRCMYGEQCFGIVGRDPLCAFIADLLEANGEEAHALAIKLMRASRQDSMGRDMIVYFPGYQLPAEFDPGDEDSDD